MVPHTVHQPRDPHNAPPWQGVFLRERDPRPMEAIGRPSEVLEDVIEGTIELLARMQQEEPPIGGRPGAVFDRLVSLDNEPGPRLFDTQCQHPFCAPFGYGRGFSAASAL